MMGLSKSDPVEKGVIMKFSYQINGMHCNACIEKIKSVLSTQYTLTNITLNPPLLEIEADKEPLPDDLNVLLKKAGNYSLQIHDSQITNKTMKTGLAAYYPLLLIFIYIFGISLINNIHSHHIDLQGWMNDFMAGFFIVFSAFKLLDIRGFAEGYATYDLLAKRWHTYGYIYPFLELGLGILYLTNTLPTFTQITTILIMGFSSLGVINSLVKKEKIQCACLGTLLKIPLSSITLFEDLIMVILAVFSLLSTQL